MTVFEPRRGQLIRYNYLWSSEAEAGQQEGRKDRPCAVVIAHTSIETGKTEVVVAPITHSPPVNDPKAIEIPQHLKRALGLDDERSWIITNDLNVFTWPGYDIRPVVAGTEITPYGELPRTLSDQLLKSVAENMQVRELRSSWRD